MDRMDRLDNLVLANGHAFVFPVHYSIVDLQLQPFGLFQILLHPFALPGFWLIIVSYLQHQDEEVEVYEEGNWDFVKGQVQTIDRQYGFGIDQILHHITDGHVAHHFFYTKIPHYHLSEATKAICTVLEQYPGLYKQQKCYMFLLEFLRLNI
uniref:Fatty acid desaturase domain-containing protein n=1 Tax=Ditylenchus dipsaci TaxID=166011 RepID=A0A915ERN7_9BILA